ncbi:MAG: hypothetical protein ACYC1I_05645 [Acidimicrobiales bacterium]
MLAKNFPACQPQVIHRVYRIFPGEALVLFGEKAADCVPDEGLVDVHRYLSLALDDKRVLIDVTFPGPTWDGENSMELACGSGQDFLCQGDADLDKRRLEREFCDPEVREAFIAALSTMNF